MPSSRKIVFFETNEIPYRVFDHYAKRNPRSHVAGLLAHAKQFQTVCEDQVELDPWISWSTLHRGVIDEQHQIFHLGQSLDYANRRYPPLWDLLARAGVKVGVMGSLHSSTLPQDLSNYAFYVPDFFAHQSVAHPSELSAFQEFNLAMTRMSARNVDRRIPIRETKNFIAHYVRHGLTLGTVRTAVSALAAEVLKPHLRCRRRSIQPLITLDLFMHLMESTRPAFATLYTNHVAAAMHRYWAATFPDDADNAMPQDWRNKFGAEIDYSMDVLDAMLGRLKAFCDSNDEYTLVCASSMGQAAVSSRVSKAFVSISNLQQFMARMGLSEGEWSERFGMVPCVSVVVSPGRADLFERSLERLRIGDKPMVKSDREVGPLSYGRKGDSFQLYVYFEGHGADRVFRLGDEVVRFEDLGIGDHVHQDDVACSARHTPHGACFVYDPRTPAADQSRSEISTLDVAPVVLHSFGVEIPGYMNAPDPRILDTSAIGTSVRVGTTGGGVEQPVTRRRQGAGGIAAVHR